jgi:hypothetical protein
MVPNPRRTFQDATHTCPDTVRQDRCATDAGAVEDPLRTELKKPMGPPFNQSPKPLSPLVALPAQHRLAVSPSRQDYASRHTLR